MQPIRVDDEIELRPYEQGDAEELFALTDANREHLRAWLPWVDATRSARDTRVFIRQVNERGKAGEEFGYGILYREKLVGAIALRIDRDAQEAEIGYWLAADAQGQGIITRASAALTGYAFGELGMHRVAILCAVGNARSAAVPERLGFTMEGVLREREHVPGRPPMDQRYYGLLRSEWAAREEARPRG